MVTNEQIRRSTKQEGIRVSSVAGVEVETVSNNMKIARRAEPNDLSTRFSLPYAVATAIIHGHTGPEAFVPDKRVSNWPRLWRYARQKNSRTPGPMLCQRGLPSI